VLLIKEADRTLSLSILSMQSTIIL